MGKYEINSIYPNEPFSKLEVYCGGTAGEM